MEGFSQFYKKHREIITYLIVGVLTTVVSLVFYYASTRTFLDPENPFQLQIANIIKWVTGVLFAYVANRIFVFRSKRKDIFREFCQFAISRVVTLIMDMVIMWALVSKAGVYDLLANLVSMVAVTIGNYIFSKLFVFRAKKQ